MDLKWSGSRAAVLYQIALYPFRMTKKEMDTTPKMAQERVPLDPFMPRHYVDPADFDCRLSDDA